MYTIQTILQLSQKFPADTGRRCHCVTFFEGKMKERKTMPYFMNGTVIAKDFETLVSLGLFQAFIAKTERFSFNKLALSLLPNKFTFINYKFST